MLGWSQRAIDEGQPIKNREKSGRKELAMSWNDTIIHSARANSARFPSAKREACIIMRSMITRFQSFLVPWLSFVLSHPYQK